LNQISWLKGHHKEMVTGFNTLRTQGTRAMIVQAMSLQALRSPDTVLQQEPDKHPTFVGQVTLPIKQATPHDGIPELQALAFPPLVQAWETSIEKLRLLCSIQPCVRQQRQPTAIAHGELVVRHAFVKIIIYCNLNMASEKIFHS
jgi:hypothetical protein